MSRTDYLGKRTLAGAALAVIALIAAVAPAGAKAAESYGNCVGFIDSLPAQVSTQGVWCLRKDLTTALTSGVAIHVLANNVTVDCNGFKIGGLAAGPGTFTSGIASANRSNIRVRRCSIRGFAYGIYMNGGGGNVVESNRFDGNTTAGILMSGCEGCAIRRNLVVDTGGGTVLEEYRRDGILGTGHVDIQDNTVSGVSPSTLTDKGVAGLYVADGIIIGNRISGLQSSYSATGIGAAGVVAGIIADNFISGDGDTGIYCYTGGTPIARNNTVNGFTSGVAACSDGGGNVHRP